MPTLSYTNNFTDYYKLIFLRASSNYSGRGPWGGGKHCCLSRYRVRGSFPRLRFERNKNIFFPSTRKTQYCGEPSRPRGSVLSFHFFATILEVYLFDHLGRFMH